MQQMELVPLSDAGVTVEHHFSLGVYAKQVNIPAGRTLVQHRHTFDHMSILAEGHARVMLGERVREYWAPAVINIPANKHHAVESVTDCVWYCVHHTHETDPEKIDHAVVMTEN